MLRSIKKESLTMDEGLNQGNNHQNSFNKNTIHPTDPDLKPAQHSVGQNIHSTQNHAQSNPPKPVHDNSTNDGPTPSKITSIDMQPKESPTQQISNQQGFEVPSISKVEPPKPSADLSSNNFNSPQINNTSLGSTQNASNDLSIESTPVVKVWSVRGLEYALMSFMLWFIASAITWVLVALINDQAGFAILSPALAILIVSVPIFSYLFLRLKKAELMDPALKKESSKRKFSQITQIVSFFIVFFSLITIVGSVLAQFGGDDVELGKTISSSLAFIVVWGSLLGYYWHEEHKNKGF